MEFVMDLVHVWTAVIYAGIEFFIGVAFGIIIVAFCQKAGTENPEPTVDEHFDTIPVEDPLYQDTKKKFPENPFI